MRRGGRQLGYDFYFSGGEQTHRCFSQASVVLYVKQLLQRRARLQIVKRAQEMGHVVQRSLVLCG